MKPNRYITPEIENGIVHYIEVTASRNGKITWQQITDHFGYTRAALSRNKVIADAYKSSKDETKTIITDAERIESLTTENAKLINKLSKANKIIEEYDSKYINWLYNAQSVGLTPEKINMPIPESFKTTMRKKGSK
jgi:hypothetical protein